MTQPHFLSLPAEVRSQIWQMTIEDTTFTICKPLNDHHKRQFCSRRGNHKRPLDNPNMNILLVNKQISAEVAALLPQGIKLQYSKIKCVWAHLRDKPLLRRRVQQITVNEYTSMLFSQRRLMEHRLDCKRRAKEAFWALIGTYQVQERVLARSEISGGIKNKHTYRYKTVIWREVLRQK